MVIDKTALLRAIREDYKGQGYMVARRAGSDEDDEGVLVINSSDWLVEIEWKNVPPEVIGLVAQHLKGLPCIGEAFKVQKKETNTAIFNMVERFPEIDPKGRLLLPTVPGLCMKIWRSGRKTGTTAVCSSR